MVSDNWQGGYAAAERLAQKTYQAIEERNHADRGSALYSRADREARSLLERYKQAVASLGKTHIRNAQSFHLTSGEVDRRQGMLDDLLTTERQLNQKISPDQPNPWRSTSAGVTSSGNPWVDDADIHHNDMSVQEIRQHQQNLIKEQDEGIDVLHKVIQRQKEIGIGIGNEIERQNGLIDDVTDNVDVANSRVQQETARARDLVLKENKGSCAIWTTIILLMVAIIVILAIQ